MPDGPGALVAWLLRALPADLREPIEGDLAEEYAAMRSGRSGAAARLWAIGTALRLAVRFQWERASHVRGVPPIAEELRRNATMWDTLRQDIGFSIRTLRRQPGFTAVALLALALGIGANTAIFSIVDSVLWRPMPFAGQDLIMSVAEQRPREGRLYGAVSPADFYDWRREAADFSAMAAFNVGSFNLTGSGEPERLKVLSVSAGFLDVLGVSPARGRNFRLEEETRGAHRVVLLSDALWRRRFGADPAVVGQRITFDGVPFEVIGVLPAAFWWPSQSDVLVPLALTAEDRALRGAHFLEVVGRLKPGSSESGARERLNVIGAQLAQAYPDDNLGHGPSIRPLRDWLVGDTRTALLVLLGAVGCVLLIACANVATLLLARATVRQKELSVRRAVGATRGRLVRQMMTESLVVALLGGAAGLVLAAWGLAAFRALLPAQFSELPGVEHVGLDMRVLAVALAATVATGLIFGAMPALVASDQRTGAMLHEESRGKSGGLRTRRWRAALVIVELAVSLVLLTGAGLLIVSFSRLTRVSPGFQPEHLVTAQLNLPGSRYGEGSSALSFYETLMDRLRGTPGVIHVAVVSAPPFSGLDGRLNLDIEHQSWELKGPVRAHPRLVSSEYFQTMGIPVMRGRGLSDRDTASMPPVVVINETAARRFWPGVNPIGQRITMGRETRWMEIVGVVGDIRHAALNAEVEPEVFVPERQGFTPLGLGLQRSLWVMVRSSLDGVAFAPALRQAVTALDPQQPIGAVRTMDAMIAESVSTHRLNFVLVSAFAVVAVLLTAAGLYGVMAYLVAQRTREIGVRVALGATPRQVVMLVMRQAGGMTAAGVAIGVAGSLVLTQSLASLLFGVSARDPWIYLAVSGLVFAVAFTAVVVPSARASRIDPLTALRDG